MIKAWRASKPGAAFERTEYDPGPIQGDEVEIAVTSCGLCHSDLSLHEDEWGITQFPLIPGHEVVGVITETGPNVTHLKAGDTVGVGWFSRSCLTCDPCMHGDHNMCEAVEMIAVGRPGGFADKVRVQASWANRLPDDLKAEDAGPLFCGGITVFNPIVQFGVKPTDRVGVIGIGGLGHLALQFLNAWGCEVTAFTSTGAKADEDPGKMGWRHSNDGHRPWGTIHCSAVNAEGEISATTTTSGLFFKVPGRVGDSPLPGCGCYADNDVGAAGSTGRGEAVIKTVGTHTIVEAMRRGEHPQDACVTALERVVDWTVEDRLLNERGRPNFGLNYYAVNKKGQFGGASIYAGAQFAVHDGTESRLVDSAYIFEGEDE